MKRVEIDHQGQRVVAYVERVNELVWIHWNGETYTLADEQASGRRSRAGLGGAGQGQIHAPMPGKITKVLAQLGAEVQPGEPLVVMEAMKMEYTLKSDRKGPVEKVNCRVGDQVTQGQILVQIAEGG